MRLKTAIGLLPALIGGLLSATAPTATAQGASPPPASVPGEVIVAFRDDPSLSPRSVRRDLGLRLKQRAPGLGVELARVPEGATVEDTVAALNADPAVAYAEPNYIYEVSMEPDDPGYSEQWALAPDVIRAPAAWDVTTGSPSVRIAVVDTGVDLRHPDLEPNLWTNPAEIPGNLIDDDGNGYADDVHGFDFAALDSDPSDAQGHGTHVAGIAGAQGNDGRGVAGTTWDARIVALRALDDDGLGTTLELAQAFEYAGSMGFRVVNASLGGSGYSVTLHRSVQDNPETLFVVSAGNGGDDGIGDDNSISPSYPCDFPEANVICVTATDRNDELAVFANRGAESVDLAAPGVDILSTLTGGRYATASGTSMATPFVSGTAALLWSLVPKASVADVRAAILSSVEQRTSLLGTTASGGRLDVFGAMAALAPDLAPSGDPAPTEPEPEPSEEPIGPSDPEPLDSGVKVLKRSGKVMVSGWVTPVQRGAVTIKVVLKKRKDGGFRTIKKKFPLLNGDVTVSDYKTKFGRPKRGRCRVVTRFEDTSRQVTKARRTFNC